MFIASSYSITWIRTNRRNPCPICGITGAGFCEVSSDGKTAHCMNVPSERPTDFRLGGWFHDLTGTTNSRGNESSSAGNATIADLKPINIEPLSPVMIHKVNLRLLELCPLSKAHADYLIGEGISTNGTGTFSSNDNSKIARKLLDQFGETVCKKHPALIQKTGKGGSKYWTISVFGGSGILFPATNIDGLILGIQIRFDDTSTGRYRWLSHDGLGGTPLTIFKAPNNSNITIITEGYKKASAASKKYGCHAISLAGVDAYNEKELLKTLDTLGASRVILAFDQDKRTKPQVKRAEAKLVKLLNISRPNLYLEEALWNSNKAKGLDDAIKAEIEITLRAFNLKRPKVDTRLPFELWQRVHGQSGNLQPVLTLDEVREKTRAKFREILIDGKHVQWVCTNVTGTGKSSAMDSVISELMLSEQITLRLILMCPTTNNLKERTAPGQPLYFLLKEGIAAIQMGRQFNTKPGTLEHEFACWNEDAQKIGNARHITAKIACGNKEHPCPFAEQCKERGYLASRIRSKEAKVVIATKESYLNNSRKQLSEFKLIICDEDLTCYLHEEFNIATYTVPMWEAKISAMGLNLPKEMSQLFEILTLTLNNELPRMYGKEAENHPNQNRLYPAMAALRAAAATVTGSEDWLSWQVFPAPTSAKAKNSNVEGEGEGEEEKEEQLIHDNSYSFEKPYWDGKTEAWKIPYRACADFIEALAHGDNRIYAVKMKGGGFALKIRRVREHLIETLQHQTVIILDATVSQAVRAFFPAIEEIRYDAPQALETWQITNAMYTATDLHNPTTRATVSKVINRFTDGSNKPLVMMPKRFQPGIGEEEQVITVPEGCLVEHWGLHKATNKYQECDRLVLVGNYQRPIDETKAEVQLLRSYGYLPPAAEVGADQPQTPMDKLRIYNYVDEDGFTAGRYCTASPDTVLQEFIEADYDSHIIQAIGRLRAVLQPSERPKQVLILGSIPVKGIKIDHLTTSQRLLSGREIPLKYPPIVLDPFINNNYENPLKVVGDKIPESTEEAVPVPMPVLSSLLPTPDYTHPNFVSTLLVNSSVTSVTVETVLASLEEATLALLKCESSLEVQLLLKKVEWMIEESNEKAELLLEAHRLVHCFNLIEQKLHHSSCQETVARIKRE